jgi:hypothetical protein
MVTQFPPSNTPSVEAKWVSSLQLAINKLESALAALNQDSGNSNLAQNSTMKLLSNQIVNLSQSLQEAVDSITIAAGQITPGAFGSGVTINQAQVTGDWVSANVTGGNVFAQSVGTNITATRVSVWGRTADGFLGTASSSERYKTNIVDALLSSPERAKKILSIGVKHYNYIAELAKREENPDYHVHLEVGAIAEDLHAAGLWEFVVYQRHEDDSLVLDENGEPVPDGIHYHLFSLAVLAVTQYQQARLDDLEERIKALEGK